MNCEKYNNGCCEVASELAGISVVTNKEACSYCLSLTDKCSPNKATASLAFKSLLEFERTYQSRRQKIISFISVEKKKYYPEGPGTELEKLISWFKVKSSKCNCGKRIQKMNEWGPDKCEERMDTILRWLQHSAITNKLPFVRPVVEKLVRKAISNARSKMGSSGNDSTS
jgi:hypothetical protein